MFSSFSMLARRHFAAVVLPAAMFAVLAGAAAAAVDAMAPGAAPVAATEQLAAASLQATTAATASVAAAHRHANAEHPAVAQWRQSHSHAAALDPNRFIVQPPATARWTASSGQ